MFQEDDATLAMLEGIVLTRLLGRGAHGRVYACKLEGDGPEQPDDLAVKIGALGKHEREIATLMSACKVGVPVLPSSRSTLVMARLDADLTTRPPKQRALREIAYIVDSLVLAVATCHMCGFVHRDIKPSNVRLISRSRSRSSNSKACLLSDWGTAATFPGPADESYGSYFDTVSYRSPEVHVLHGSASGPASDWWSTGCTIVELMTSRRLFVTHSRSEHTTALTAYANVCTRRGPEPWTKPLPARARPDTMGDHDYIMAIFEVYIENVMDDVVRMCHGSQEGTRILTLIDACLKLYPNDRLSACTNVCV